PVVAAGPVVHPHGGKLDPLVAFAAYALLSRAAAHIDRARRIFPVGTAAAGRVNRGRAHPSAAEIDGAGIAHLLLHSAAGDSNASHPPVVPAGSVIDPSVEKFDPSAVVLRRLLADRVLAHAHRLVGRDGPAAARIARVA